MLPSNHGVIITIKPISEASHMRKFGWNDNEIIPVRGIILAFIKAINSGCNLGSCCKIGAKSYARLNLHDFHLISNTAHAGFI